MIIIKKSIYSVKMLFLSKKVKSGTFIARGIVIRDLYKGFP